MSRFLSEATAALKPYTPGEQPRDTQYIKLNTNENPYPPAPEVTAAIAKFSTETLRLYPDPTSTELRAAVAESYSLKPEQVFVGGGSDEVLAYAFMAFCDMGSKVYFPDITYGFYKVYADLFSLTAIEIPLKEDFTVDVGGYRGLDGNIFIANPNAPTGICLSPAQIEEILKANPDRLVVADEAYADFSGGKSCLRLIEKYDNLLIVQTFSKSRSLAGMRLAAGFGCPELIAGLERIKFSFNPYNLDRVSLAAGIAAMQNNDYMRETATKVISTRERTRQGLLKRSFTVLPSDANFLFAKSPRLSGFELYDGLKRGGVLVRHFDKDRIRDFVRITMGTDAEMDIFFQKLDQISNGGLA